MATNATRPKRPSRSIAALMPRDFRRLRTPSHTAFAGHEATWEAIDGRYRLRRIKAVYSVVLPAPIWHLLRLIGPGPNRWALIARSTSLPATVGTLARLRAHEGMVLRGCWVLIGG